MVRNGSNDGRRARVLSAVRAAPTPIGVAELAEALSVHPNTVRFHLDALERTGEIERAETEPEGRGRPRVRYRSATAAGVGSPGGERRYELLAGILAAGLEGTEQGRARAAEAGYAWGFARARSTVSRGGDPVGALLGLLYEAGFAPRRAAPDTVELLNCPFREAVASHGELVCGVHAGVMRGALAGWGAPVEMTALEPFAVPHGCRARLARVGAA